MMFGFLCDQEDKDYDLVSDSVLHTRYSIRLALTTHAYARARAVAT